MTENYGLKITREGYDITDTDPQHYVFSSKFSSVKIYEEYTGTITANAGTTGTATIAHGLPFVPMFMCFTELSPGSGKWFFGILTNYGGGDSDAGDCEVVSYADGSGDIVGTYVDATNIKLQIKNYGGSQKVVKYHIFAFADNGQ